MYIIVQKTLLFLRDGYNGEQVMVRPSSRPQLVPDWVRDTDTFKLAGKDESALEVEIKPYPTSAASPANNPVPAEHSSARTLLRLSGPDDVELRIEPCAEGCVWRIRNGGLGSIERISLQIISAQSIDSEKRAFREAAKCGTSWPLIQKLAPAELSAGPIFIAFESQHLRLGQTLGNELVWPKGDPSAIRRWRLNMILRGLSRDWPIQLDLRWTVGTTTLQLMEHSGSTGAAGAAADQNPPADPGAGKLSASLEGPSPDFWRARRSEFDALLTRQRSILRQDTRSEWLKGRCRFFEEDGQFGRCGRQGGFDGIFISHFDDVATRAAYARGCPPGVEPVFFWIYCLGKDLLKAREPAIRREFAGDDSVGCIQGLLESSVGYCSRLAAEAERRENDAASRGVPESSDVTIVQPDSYRHAPQTDPSPTTERTQSDELPKPLKPIGGGPIWRSGPIVTIPRIVIDYPADFPESARSCIFREQVRAGDVLEEKKSSIRSDADLKAALLSFVLSVFGAYAREVCELGQQAVWGAERCESECLKVLWQAIRAVRLVHPDETDTKTQVKIERTEEWKEYRRQLREVAERQAPREPAGPQKSGRTGGKVSGDATAAKEARAGTVARILGELNRLKPQMFEDETEYRRLCDEHPDFLTFTIARERADLKLKILAIRGSTRHMRLAQELAAAHHGRQLGTIQDDWKRHKPVEFRRRK
jgi:hypothetical protein